MQSPEERQKNQKLEQDWMGKHNFNQWYNILGAETFKSIMIDLSKEEASALALQYKINQQKHKINDENKETEFNNSIQQLKSKIETNINEKLESKHYFVRLSSRSPKDAPMWEPFLSKTQQLMYDDLKLKSNMKVENIYNLNDNTISYLQSCINCTKVSNSNEIIELLTNSLRIYEDLNMFEFSNLKIIIREWKDIKISNEYRGFVGVNGNLNGLSQYYPFLYFENVPLCKDKIKNIIVDYYNSNIKQKLMTSKLFPCVIDFALLETVESDWKNIDNIENDKDEKAKDKDKEKEMEIGKDNEIKNDRNDNDEIRGEWQVKVIELNMFHDYDDQVMIESGASLFDWEKDKKILLNGPFEFRIRTSVPSDDDIESHIGADWNNITGVVKKLENEINTVNLSKQESTSDGNTTNNRSKINCCIL